MRFAACFIGASFAAICLLPFGCSGEETGPKGEGGQPEPCTQESDCDDGNGCTFDFCIDGFCTFDVADDTPDPEAEQVDGDCMSINCSKGERVIEIDNGDLPNDPDEGDCTIPNCIDGVPGTEDQAIGESCNAGNDNQGVCSAGGVCSCAPGQATDTHYVNPNQGTDADTNGGGPGGCAFRTLDYALARAQDEIRLSFDDVGPTDATFPIRLSGTQWLNCPYDQDNDARVTITGTGTHIVNTTVIAFVGSRNGIDDCLIDAAGTAEYGVMVATPSPNERHFFDFAQIRGSTLDGVLVMDPASGFDSRQTLFTSMGGNGINFGSGPKNGFLDENTIDNMVCGDPSPELNGQNNSINGTCVVCELCN